MAKVSYLSFVVTIVTNDIVCDFEVENLHVSKIGDEIAVIVDESNTPFDIFTSNGIFKYSTDIMKRTSFSTVRNVNVR